MQAVLVASQSMNKRLALKLAMAIVVLWAVTLLQGCGEEDDFAYSFVWAPPASGPVLDAAW
jgi:hypothetical protein